MKPDPNFTKGTLRDSNLIERTVRNPLFWVIFISFVFGYPIYKSLNRVLPPDLPVIGVVPEFEMISENGQRFGSKELKGKAYLANFIFSRCPTACPRMLVELQKIQKRIRGTAQKVHIVSFTVDPTYDNEKVLFDLARKYDANPHIWTFLTKESEDELFTFYKDGFKVGVEKKPEDLFDIAHSERIVLVDGKGQIRGYYSFDEDSINKLMIDVGLLINRPDNKE